MITKESETLAIYHLLICINDPFTGITTGITWRILLIQNLYWKCSVHTVGKRVKKSVYTHTLKSIGDLYTPGESHVLTSSGIAWYPTQE
jgi:hypothetical protein